MKPQRGGGWVLAQAILMAAVAVSGLIWTGQWHSPALGWTGLALLGFGVIFGIAGARALGRGLTPFPRPRPDARLVQHGIYRWMRHPLYTAVGCGLLGWALWRESGPAFGAAALTLIFFDVKARQEERWLHEQFPEYAEYAHRVSRFIPGVY